MATATRTAAVATQARRSATARTAPRPAPRAPERARPELRVVEQARRERRRRVGLLVSIGVALAMFAIAGSQTLIISQQGHIDSVNRGIANAEDRAQALRLELAELKSPQHITSEATTRLGMIPAPTPVYLQPRSTDDQRAAELPPAPAPAPTWTAAKTR